MEITPQQELGLCVTYPENAMGRVANRIINEVTGINRLVYDESSKPPTTIEWE